MNKLSIYPLLLFVHLTTSTIFCQEQTQVELPTQTEAKSVAVFPALANAQKQLKRATRDYEELRRLVARGSGSNSSLRRALLVKKIAELQLAAIQKPGFAPEYARKSAKLKFAYARKEYEISKSLYGRGSVSTIRHRRKTNEYRIAKVEFAIAKGEIEEEQGELKIAKLELQQAESDYQSAKRLFEKGSLRRSTYENVRDIFLDAKSYVKELRFEDT